MRAHSPAQLRALTERRRRYVWALLAILGVLLVGVGILATLQPKAPHNATGIAVGRLAPTAPLLATTGGSVSLAGYRGHRVVLFFYEGAT
jgi:hypothetical protein